MVKTINTRIQLKSDTEENWRKAVLTEDNARGTKESVSGAKSFVPQNGEAIIFKADVDHNYPRLKIGDGVSNVLSLPFIDAGTVNGHTIDINVPSNAIFTDTTYTGKEGISINTNNEIGHSNSITASGSTGKVYKITYDAQGHITEAEEINVGTVTSIQVQASDPLQSSNSSVSTTTLNTTISFKSVDSHLVFAGPSSGGETTPSFRSLISDDIPELSATKITSGTLDVARIPSLSANKITSDTLSPDRIPNINLTNKIDGVLPISHGGTGRNGSAENDSFKDGEVFLYNSTSNRFEQIGITHLANGETFAHYLAEGGENNTAPSDSLLVNLELLRTAVPPINLKNVADTTNNSYRLSYYAPVSKGRLNSVLISVADANNAHNSNSEADQASVEQIPIWLDPNNLAGVDNSGHGGTLYFGRDEEAETESLNKPFKTQWGILPIEQGGTGHYEFPTDDEGGSVLLGYGKQSLTTIRKSTSHINNTSTLVERTSTGDFSTNKITLTSGIDASFRSGSEGQEETITSNVITIANGNVTLHGNLDADDLNANVGILNMIRSGHEVAEQPIMNWYKSIKSGTTITNTKLGEIYWDINNGRGVLTNIYTPLDTTRIDSYYLPPTDPALNKDNTFTFLATADTINGVLSPNSILFSPSGKYNQISAILNTPGAFYSDGNNSPSYGILPIVYGGTGANTKPAARTNLEVPYIGGDTFTGNVTIQKNGDTNLQVINSNTNVAISLDSDSIGKHGIFSYGYLQDSNFITDTKWMIYRNNNDGEIIVNGNAYGLRYQETLNTDEKIDNFLESNHFKIACWTSTNSPGVSNGVILSGAWSTNNYGFQLAIDDDPSYYMALRQKGSSGWLNWKRIPMGDGTGASGTWPISITGNAATATTASSCTGNAATATTASSCSGNAATATKATQDGSGNVITSKYVTLDTAQTITGTKSWGTNGAGGQLNGAATNGGINSIRVGDDVWLGDCNAAGIMGMKSTGTNCGFYMYNSSGTDIGHLYFDGTNLVCNKNINANILGNAATATAAQNTAFAVKAPHPWPAFELGTNSATNSDYTSPGNTTWVMLYATCPALRKSDNYRYSVNFFVREYSRNDSGGRLNYYEDYYLPNCNTNRTNTASYNILTTKSAVTIDQGGTGATTAAAARQNLFGTSMADTAKYFITINDNWATGGYITNAKAAEIIRSNASGSWGISITGNCDGSSSSCTGNAATATKLTTDAGNSNTPVYFSGGKPVATNNKLGAISANGYWGMRGADNGDSWIRTTSLGIIPVQAGNAGSGHCGLGTSTWYFSYAYVDNYYGNWSGNAISVPQGGTGATNAAGARDNLGIKSESGVSCTLNSNKNYDLGNNYAITSRTVIAVGCTSTTAAVVPYMYNSHWWIAVRKLSDFTPISTDKVTVTITYIQL